MTLNSKHGLTDLKRFSTLELKLSHQGVLSLKLNRPDVRNAFNEVLIAELLELSDEAAQDPRVRVVVLGGVGPNFCAGGDLNWMKRSASLTYGENLEDTTRLVTLFEKLNRFPKPLIGAVHGAAIGGGVGLVSVCDCVIATEDTVFSLSEVRLGIVPACIGPFVIAKIGASHARRFFVLAERFKAEKAREIGLIHEVVADAAALDHAVSALVENILACGPGAVTKAKELVLDLSWPERRRDLDDPGAHVAKMLAELRVSPEGQEGVRAFLEKRKPSWILSK